MMPQNQEDRVITLEAQLEAEKEAHERAERTIVDARKLLIEEGSYGSIVELLFYAPLREAEARNRALLAENTSLHHENDGLCATVLALQGAIGTTTATMQRITEGLEETITGVLPRIERAANLSDEERSVLSGFLIAVREAVAGLQKQEAGS